jgi:Ca2+:H+ antiporter
MMSRDYEDRFLDAQEHLDRFPITPTPRNSVDLRNMSTDSVGMGEHPLGFPTYTRGKKLVKSSIRPSILALEFVNKLRSTRLATADTSGEEPSERSALVAVPEGENQELHTVWAELADIFFGKTVSFFLFLVPLAILSKYLNWSATAVFWLNFFAMIPLAAILGDFTEEVAAHTNQVIGGLVNATFGNAVEVVVAVQALLRNEIRVVQASMIGSIFSNLLLVLGCCFFFGGLRFKEQSFNGTAATANMGLLGLSSIALVVSTSFSFQSCASLSCWTNPMPHQLPTPFSAYYEIQDDRVLIISRTAAIFLISMYIQLLVFQLRTHVHLFEEEGQEQASIGLKVALAGLVFTTLLITVLSDMLVESIDGFVSATGISRTFVGLIILPIVGNAVEHVTAITVAMKDKMDLAMGVAVGSCTQISLFVVPFTVLCGWALDRNMTLNFPHFEITLFVLSVVIVSICLSNPKTNWLEGSLLITTYIMVAVGFFFEDVEDFED